MFIILAVFIIGSALMCVTTTRIMRAATFMLFVLFGVAGIYFLLDYTFLGAAQISVYAGGVTMIYVFAIQLVSKRTLQGLEERVKSSKMIGGGLAALAGLAVVWSLSSGCARRLLSTMSTIPAISWSISMLPAPTMACASISSSQSSDSILVLNKLNYDLFR